MTSLRVGASARGGSRYAAAAAMTDTAIEKAERGELSRPYRPNFLVAWLYRRIFAGIEVDPVWVDAVRRASAQGTVVYVMRSVSYLDFVALDFFLKKFSLPLIRFVTDMGLWILEPFRTGFRRLFRRREPEGPVLERAIRRSESALFFMRKPRAATAFKRRGDRLDVDHVKLLIDLQREQDRPILLVPQVLVWGTNPDRLHKGFFDQIFGPQEYPGKLRILGQLFLGAFRNARLNACEPLNLRQLIADHPDLDDAALVSKIHWLLVTRLDRERRLIIGPMAKSHDRILEEVFRNPKVRAAAVETAAREKKPQHAIDREIRRDLRRLGARPTPIVVDWASATFHAVVERIYSGIEIDEEGVQRIREAAREGPLVLLPSHKSHIDYLLISYVFHRHGLQVPLIAAGDNLAFWPAGPILRRAGAFFIRRSFGGARMYATLVDAYVRKLLKEGYAIEFFLEGGRSRTGKLLPPKLGLLSMVVDAADAAGQRVSYVPISIGYEKIVEEQSYVAEMQGLEKRKEDAGALLRVPRLLVARYGRAFMQVGDILRVEPRPQIEPPVGRLSDRPPPAGPSDTSSPATGRAARRATLERMQARRAEVTALARRIAYQINRVTPATPTALVATALLVHRRRGIVRADLLRTIDTLVFELQRDGARFASNLAIDYQGGRRPYRVDAIDQSIQMLADAREIQVHGSSEEPIYSVPDDCRLALAYYKNNVAHFFVPQAMVSSALLAHADGPPATRAELRARYERLCQWLSMEFSLRDDTRAAFDDALGRLVDATQVDLDGDGDTAVARPRDDDAREALEFHAGHIRGFLESRRIVLRALHVVLRGSVTSKELVKRGLSAGERMFLAGEVSQRESVSKSNLENALAALRDAGVVSGGEGAPHRLITPNDTDAALRALERETAAFV